ncbi:MAG: glycosyltransferase [Cyanobium sp.]
MSEPPLLILATRFSWPHPIWETRSSEEYAQWLEERLKLFARYTVRSVANCYSKPDYWVLLIGSQHDHIRDRLETILEHIGCRIIFAPYIGVGLGLTTMLACADIAYPCRVVTTSLDADDLVATDFFDMLRHSDYPRSGNAIVSFTSGCNYMPHENTYYHSSYPNNPFLSLYEEVRGPHEAQTIFFRMHTEISNYVRHQITPRSYYPMWASVVHGGNLANLSLIETNRLSFRDTEALHQRFGLLT